jgi:hypothetical protein
VVSVVRWVVASSPPGVTVVPFDVVRVRSVCTPLLSMVCWVVLELLAPPITSGDAAVVVVVVLVEDVCARAIPLIIPKAATAARSVLVM